MYIYSNITSGNSKTAYAGKVSLQNSVNNLVDQNSTKEILIKLV